MPRFMHLATAPADLLRVKRRADGKNSSLIALASKETVLRLRASLYADRTTEMLDGCGEDPTIAVSGDNMRS